MVGLTAVVLEQNGSVAEVGLEPEELGFEFVGHVMVPVELAAGWLGHSAVLVVSSNE